MQSNIRACITFNHNDIEAIEPITSYHNETQAMDKEVEFSVAACREHIQAEHRHNIKR